MCPPFEPPSHLPPHPTPLWWYSAPVRVSWDIHKFPLAICVTYGNVSFHGTLSIQLTLPPSTYVYSLCLFFLCCPVSKFFSTIFLDSIYIYVRMWYLSFSFWLTSLCIIGSRFIHLFRTDSNVIILMAEKYSIVLHHNFFIHSSVVDGHLGCFHVLAIVNSVPVNNGIHVSLSV